MGQSGEEGSFPKEREARAAEHLPLEHLDALTCPSTTPKLQGSVRRFHPHYPSRRRP